MSKLKYVRPVMWTENIPESIEFYTQILGFNLDEYSEEWNWASLSKDEVGIMFAKPNRHEDFGRIGFSGSFYFNADDVDGLWEQLKDKVKVCYEPENFDWGMREFAIYDNNGYLLQFGQNLEKSTGITGN